MADALLLLMAASAPVETTAPVDIVVTGERIARPLSQTASSVSAVTAQELEHRPDADRLDQLLPFMANVQLGSSGTGPTIRGQDTTGALRDLSGFLGGSRPRATVIVDGRAVSYLEYVFGNQPVWDVSRVELFRTPQTTTQGRNSIAGAIFVETADPEHAPKAKVRMLAGSFLTRQFSAALTAPLAGDTVGARISADWRRSRPSSRLTELGHGVDLNRDDTALIRAKLVIRPNTAPGSRLTLTAVYNRSAMPQLEGIRPPFRSRRDPSAGYGFFRVRSTSLTARFDAPLTPKLDARATLSTGIVSARRFAPPGLGLAANQVRDRSAELVLEWRSGAALQVTGGASLIQQELEQTIDLSAVLGRGAFDDHQRSTGLFGEVTLTPADRLTIGAGMRFQYDRQVRTGALAGIRGLELLDYDGRSSFWLPRLTASYRISDHLNAGILVQRAANPGGTTISVDGALAFAPETLWNTELFARGRFDGGRLMLSANVFRTYFHDAQRSVSRPFRPSGGAVIGFADIINVPRASSRGAELSFVWSATPRLDLQFSGGLLRTRLRSETSWLFGREFQRSPRWSASAGLNWRPSSQLMLSARARARGPYFSDDLETRALLVERAALVDLRAEWSRGPMRLFGYARNALDRFAFSHFTMPLLATAEDPREIGLGLEARF
jgi:outer membrane receptor protein involved in Fe transport